MHLVQRRAHEFGVRGIDPLQITFDLPAAVARKDRIIRGIVDGIYDNLRGNRGITFLRGHAEFTSPKEVKLDGQVIEADKFIIATGANVVRPPIPGLDQVGYITNREALRLEKLPASLVIIGAGFVGIEFAQMYSRFGTRVTVLGRNPRILPEEDEEISAALLDVLRNEGVTIHTSAPVTRVARDGVDKVIYARIDGVEQAFRSEEILLAAGRWANIDGLALDQAGVEVGKPGILVDRQLRTSTDNIWAIGDVTGGHMFTHRATYDGPIAALNAVRDLKREVDYRVVPRAVFTQPAVASVGLTERAAREAGYEVKVGKFPFAWSGKAKAIGETEGLIKVVVDAKTKEILGFHILGPDGDNLIHEAVVAMYNHGTLEPITRSIHIHPTLAEAVKAAAKAAG